MCSNRTRRIPGGGAQRNLQFLTDIWKEGGLQGATANDAFQVFCGLGSTMTGDDILNGFLNVTVKVAIVRPAEFLVITFEQEMAKSG
jgi:phage tail sheath protein FI